MDKKYLQAKEKALKIKRSVSNLIWINGTDEISSFFTLMGNSIYISAVELSLFNIFNSTTVSDSNLDDILSECENCSLEISGVHNIFADTENFQESLFFSKDVYNRTLNRIKEYIEYTDRLGTKNLSLDYMYFLDRKEMSKRDADRIFLSLLDEVSDILKEKDIVLSIVPTAGDYLSNYVEAVHLLEKREYTNIKILIDLVELFNTFSHDIKFFKDKERFFHHFHISNLDGSPATFDDIPMHNKIVNLSHYMDYKNSFFVMKVPNLSDEDKDNFANYQHYIHIFKEIYQVPIALSPFCSKLFPNLVYRHLSPEGPDKDHLRNQANH